MKFLSKIFTKKSIDKKDNAPKPVESKKVTITQQPVKKIPESILQELRDVLDNMKIVENVPKEIAFTGNVNEVISFLIEKNVRFLTPRSNLDFHNPRKCLTPDDRVFIVDSRRQTDFYLETSYYGVIRNQESVFYLYEGTFNDEY